MVVEMMIVVFKSLLRMYLPRNGMYSLMPDELPHKLYTDEDPINKKDINDDFDRNNLNNAIILPTSVFYNILLLFTITYV